MRHHTAISDENLGAPLSRSHSVYSSARTHLGHVRIINEDRILNRPDRRLWAIADGMGGYHDGDIAAELVISSLSDLADGEARIDGDALRDALYNANAAILDHSKKISSGIGSTVVSLHIIETVATVSWVGDSRAYLLRGTTAEQITRDHSVVQELLNAGLITSQQAIGHPKSNIITRALGISGTVEIDEVTLDIRSGDTILLCSDGYSRSLNPSEIQMECEAKSADGMMRSALERDASDNVSFIIINL